MIDCPVLNYKVVNCFGCRFFKKWIGDAKPECKFGRIQKFNESQKVEAKDRK